jgi:hypothetical protein
VAQHEQVPDRPQPDVDAHLVAEPAERRQAARAELDVRAVRELRPHAAQRLARRAGRQVVALQQHDAGHPGPRQVVRRAGAHDPAAHDDDVGRRHHGLSR